MRYLQLVIVSGFLILASCSNNQYTLSYLSQVNSLKMSLESAAESYEGIDTIEVRAQFNMIGDHLNTFKADSNIAGQQSVTVYNHVRKAYKSFLRENKNVLKELNYTRSQLTDLKNDIENGRIDEDEIEEYIGKEMQAVKAINTAMDQYYLHLEAQMKIYETLHPKFQRLADSLNHLNNIEN